MLAQIEQLRSQALEAQEAAAAAEEQQPEVVEAPAAAPAIDREELERANQRAQDAEASLADSQARVRESERKINELEERIEELKGELAEKSDRERIISEAFISAQRSAENLKEEARAEGERIYRESEAKARELIREALSKKQQILVEIDTLEASRTKFRKDYKKMLEHFTIDADNEFANMRPPVIPDSIINEMLPTPEVLAAAVQAAGVAEPDEEAGASIPEERIPAFETQVIPSVSLDAENMAGQTFADDDLDVEEV
jgi:cell division initiation protein